MKLRKGKIVMSRKERLKMWVLILQQLQRDSVSVGKKCAHKGLCNHICEYTPHLFIDTESREHLTTEVSASSFPELYKYRPLHHGAFWWHDGLLEDSQVWNKPRIETVSKIIQDLQYRDFPQYHDTHLFPTETSTSTWKYLTDEERLKIWEHFSNTAHHQFWKLGQVVKNLFKTIFNNK